MITLEFIDWERACKMIQNIPENTKNKYFQTYSFLLKNEDWNYLASEHFFYSYIKCGKFLTEIDNLSFPNRVLQKNHGDYRHVKIVSPIIYLFLVAIASQIQRIYKEKRSYYHMSAYFAGTFDEDKGTAYYKNSYNLYLTDINTCQSSYKYCFKIDFATFFPLVDVDDLFSKVKNLDPKSELIYSSLIKMIGRGKMPIVDGNTGLSYLNTIVYLDDFDAELIKHLEKIKEIQGFQLIRYVDDLAIFINCDESDLPYLNSKVYNGIQELAVKNRLVLNSSKTKHFTPTVELGSKMDIALYDFFVNNKDVDFDQYYSKDDLNYFLDNLISLPTHADFKTYESKVLSTLEKTNDLVYGASDVLNAIVYNKASWSRDKEILNKIKILVDTDYRKLRFTARSLITLILNTKDSSIIKSLLNNMFESFKNNQSDLIDEILSLEYLVQRNFQHRDLIKIIKNTNPYISEYIEKFQILNFPTQIKIKNKIYYDSKNEVYSMLDDDPYLNFLFFRYKYFESLGQTLESFAYFKNYFDRFIAHATLCMGIDQEKRPNYKKYYKEKAIKKELKNFQLSISDNEIDNIISTAHNIRNSNPVSHASAQLIKDNNLSKDKIWGTIKDLKKIIEEILLQMQTKKDI